MRGEFYLDVDHVPNRFVVRMLEVLIYWKDADEIFEMPVISLGIMNFVDPFGVAVAMDCEHMSMVTKGLEKANDYLKGTGPSIKT